MRAEQEGAQTTTTDIVVSAVCVTEPSVAIYPGFLGFT